MCGIYGVISQRDNKKEILKKMESVQIHRGPDGEGHYIDDSVALGMRRLSIIDVNNGDQPFYSKDKKVVVLCNGEIYNFKELRNELIELGYQFETGSDIEVLPHLYKEHGVDFVTKLNGMYAISLWDMDSQTFYLFRDRLGIKPLYYSNLDEGFFYASEMKSIINTGYVEKELDFEALSSFLEITYIPTPRTPFKSIKKLESASYLKLKSEKIEIINYWDPQVKVDHSMTEQDCLDELDEILKDSIEHQLISDVPLGSFLSGGVDSSLVTALSAKSSYEKFSSFHMRWNNIEGKIDESEFAQKVVDKYDLKNFTKNITEIDIPNLLAKLIWHLDEPFGDAAFVPTYILADHAAQNVKVILSGAGGDELFGGYTRYKKYSKIKSLVGKVLYNKAPAFSYYDINKGAYTRLWKNAFKWYKPGSAKNQFDSLYKENKKEDKLNAYMLGDLKLYLQDNILALTDKMTSAASIECRVPLLDHRLVEFSLKVPSKYKIKDKEYKYILKKYAEDYLDKDILYREKEGFGSPVWNWIDTYRFSHFNSLLEKGTILEELKIDTSFLMKLINQKKLDYGEYWMYWHLLVLEIWTQIYIKEIPFHKVFKD